MGIFSLLMATWSEDSIRPEIMNCVDGGGLDLFLGHDFLLLDFALIFGWLMVYMLGWVLGLRRWIVDDALHYFSCRLAGLAVAGVADTLNDHRCTWSAEGLVALRVRVACGHAEGCA